MVPLRAPAKTVLAFSAGRANAGKKRIAKEIHRENSTLIRFCSMVLTARVHRVVIARLTLGIATAGTHYRRKRKCRLLFQGQVIIRPFVGLLANELAPKAINPLLLGRRETKTIAGVIGHARQMAF